MEKRPTPGWRLQVTQGFFDVEVDQHHSAETRILEATHGVLPEAAATGLEVEMRAQGFKLARVRRLDGKLALYSVKYLLPEIEDVVRRSDVITGGGSLNRALQAAGYETFIERRSVEAMRASSEVAALLAQWATHSC